MTMLRKACECKSTSTGPRMIVKETKELSHIIFTAIYARIVCDRCNTPWIVEEETHEPDASGLPG